MADNPDQKIKLKKSHASVVSDKIVETIDNKSFPDKKLIPKELKTSRYLEIKKEAKQILLLQLSKMLNTPGLAGLMIIKK